MDSGAERLAREIGARVKQERVERGWTLDQLAGSAAARRSVGDVEHGEGAR